MPGLEIEQIVQMLTSLESRAIKVHALQCSKLRHRRSTCALCADHCPVKAITWEESLQVDPEKCTGCGICAAVCPTGALEARNPTNLELCTRIQELAKTETSIVFACPTYLRGAEGADDRRLRVNCLGRLDESILAGALSVGIQSVRLLAGACASCPHAIGLAVAEQVTHRTNALLGAFGISARIRVSLEPPCAPEPPAQPSAPSAGLSRRSFFRLLTRETARKAAVGVESILGIPNARTQKPEKGELPAALPAKRRLLLAALRRIGKSVAAESPADGGLWARFGFKEACNGCQMCAFFCPTGALSKVQEGGKVGVTFRTSHCTACRLCQEICDCGAVTLSSTVDLSKVLADSVDVLLMQEVKACPWLESPEERIKRILSEMFPNGNSRSGL
ncbi:MAG: 4Fe-4S binding protein [Candidatus Tectomicrobia bacterium]|uniref:4Fe-4S binding protein n=1 Tax=Tectimicrobiota bacterium TaxID=2528274 RepID=A0A932M0J8_UNCTE|nr:4Fe-4S binding protein [Candidatus Tectomicrobia bacterium]